MMGNEAWKKTKILLIVTFLMTMSFSPLLHIIPIKATTGYVESSDSLQDKINGSADGDTIQINTSITLTDFIIIDKSITLQGKNEASIEINGSGFGFNITTNNVTIKNISLFNCSTAINIHNQNNTLENITIDHVILLNCSNHGIYSSNAMQITVSNSSITNCSSSGIYFNNISMSTISNNSINQTSNTAVNLTNRSHNNIIYNNTYNNNSISINITFSQDNTIYNNTFLNSTTYHAFDNATNTWNTTTHGNYWDDYNGTDSNNDDIGETVHTIHGGINADEKPLGFFIPMVNFTFEPNSPSTDNTITFTSHCTDPNHDHNQHLNYSWDFGDGNTSYEENLTYSYANNGTYNVTLHVTNQYGQWNHTSQTILVTNVAPNISINISPTIGIVNETIFFNLDATDEDGEITTYTWTFGDGTKNHTKNTTHLYNESGSFTITINATDDDGEYTNISTTIVVTHKPSVNFTCSTNSPSTIDTITFTDTSTDDGSITTYNWSFGDGSYSTGQTPTHSYDDDGTYNVTLMVIDNHGASNQTNKSITVANTPPTANFSWNPQNATDLQTIQPITFTNTSFDPDGHITNCTWTFGDGTINYSMNLTSHQYADNGTYTVTLNVTDDDGDTDEFHVNITILNVDPTADFTFEPNCPEIGEQIWFNDTSLDQDGIIVNWTWDFDDNSMNYSQNTTHSYSSLTSYDVTLTITDNDGNSSSITKRLILKSTTTKSIPNSTSATYDLKDEVNSEIIIKTLNATNLTVTTFSECPYTVEENISDYENLETYLEITLENKTLLEWINFTVYYTEDDISENIDESSLMLFYWNETSEAWIQVSNCITNTLNTDGYSGFVQANISHLTLFTMAGSIIEEENEPLLTLPEIINSSNNTQFATATPTLNITYDQTVPRISATLNGTTLLIGTTDNKTFTIYIYTTLENGNYSVELHLANSSLTRTDTIHFSIQKTKTSNHSNSKIEIPLWIWYSIVLFFGFLAILYLLRNMQLFGTISKKKKSASVNLCTENGEIKNPYSKGIFKETSVTLQHSIESIENTFFGSDDPWQKTKADINQTMYNIDLFTDKPDAYVGVQEELLTNETHCDEILNLLKNQAVSIETIMEKTKLSKEDLSKELSILMKYGLIIEKNTDSFQLTTQAKKIINKK